jgi:hypothetical protein
VARLSRRPSRKSRVRAALASWQPLANLEQPWHAVWLTECNRKARSGERNRGSSAKGERRTSPPPRETSVVWPDTNRFNRVLPRVRGPSASPRQRSPSRLRPSGGAGSSRRVGRFRLARAKAGPLWRPGYGSAFASWLEDLANAVQMNLNVSNGRVRHHRTPGPEGLCHLGRTRVGGNPHGNGRERSQTMGWC